MFPRIKWIFIIIGLLIGLSSLYYTNRLVKKLAIREQQQIDLVAKAQSIVTQVEDSLMLNFLVTDILQGNSSIPMIITDDKEEPIEERNISFPNNANAQDKKEILHTHLQSMKAEHSPINVHIFEGVDYHIYYENSTLLTQLKYFPYAQLTVIGVFLLFGYFIFSASRRAEQNRVWVGLAKETAHQLGTPISALIAWVEYFRADESVEEEVLVEIEKDIERLSRITERFSSIGSVPDLKTENLLEVSEGIISYLRNRITSKVNIQIQNNGQAEYKAKINRPLFEWVIENLCKNAVDAMGTYGGLIEFNFSNGRHPNQVVIDVRDTGKGIPSSQIKSVFRAGFTTKKRGWGLGLTLAKRIIEEYHHGKIVVLKSEVNKGTTFRITLQAGTYPSNAPMNPTKKPSTE